MPKSLIFLSSLIFAAVALRWLPHPPNFSPILAVALFSGATIKNRKLALAVPLVALLISDAVIGFYDMAWAIYALYVVIILGASVFAGKRKSIATWAAMGFSGSVVFFFVSNMIVWAMSGLYSLSLSGLWQSYVMALPFFQNTLASTFVYGAGLLGAYHLVKKHQPHWVEQKA